ncbi:SIR2 family protein [Telluria sp. B2]
MPADPDIDPVLVERFASGNGTIFVGAGISSGSGMPLWSELIDPLRRQLGKGIDPCMSYLEVADLYETLYGRSELENHLRKMLGDVRFQLTRVHELIVCLPVQRIYTTNFDDLLEQASHRQGMNRTVIANASQVGLSDNSKLSIVKLHGDLNDSSSLVFTAGDYYSYFTRNPAVADLLKVELQTRTVLFLGYSFSDIDLGMILGKVASQSGATRPLLFSLQLRPSKLAVAALKRRGVKAIEIDAEPGKPGASEKIEEWLRHFALALHNYERRKYFVRERKFIVGDNFEIPRHKGSLVRIEALQRIEDGLRSEFPVVIVKGEPGIGKTAIVAAAAANAIRSRSDMLACEGFACAVWIRADPGNGTGKDPCRHTLDRILRAISSSIQTASMIPGAQRPSEVSNAAAREFIKMQEVTRLLQHERVLVVIEDLERTDSELGRIAKWLENLRIFSHPKSKIVITSHSLILDDFVVQLEELKPPEAKHVAFEQANAVKLKVLHNRLATKAVDILARFGFGNPQAIKLGLGLISLRFDACSRERPDEPDEAQPSASADHSTGAPPRSAKAFRSHVRACMRQSIEDLCAALEPLRGDPCRNIDQVFATLVNVTVDFLASSQAYTGTLPILTAMLAFPESEPAPSRLLHLAAGGEGMPGSRFAEAAGILVKAGLLERDGADASYTLHRLTREALRLRLKDGPGGAKERLANRLLEFLKDENVIRRTKAVIDGKEVIIPEYWNALVRDEMSQVDPYWRIIKHVVREVGGDRRIVDFAMVLTHYMDSRFLNDERKAMLVAAIGMLDQKANNKRLPDDEQKQAASTAALLRIDALAWTQTEEMMLDEAIAAIDEGEKALARQDDPDLRALAHCWRARIECAREKWDEAEACLEKLHSPAPLSPWIRMRTEMMQGDYFHMRGQPKRALEHYRKAEAFAEDYGGEGNGYQTSPRIGIALMATASLLDKEEDDLNKKAAEENGPRKSQPGNTGDAKPSREELEKTGRRPGTLADERRRCLEEAELRFQRLVENEGVSIGQLYGRYGRALIAARKKSTREAMRELQLIWQELYHRGGPGSQLLKLTEKLYTEIKDGRTGAA